MGNGGRAAVAVLACLSVAAFAAGNRKQLRYNVGSGATVNITNQFGPVVVKAQPGHQVVITATSHSDKVEVDGSQTAERVEAVTHFLQRSSDADGGVEYEVAVPQDASVNIHASSGPVTASGLRGDLLVDSDTGRVDIRDISHAHVHVRTVSGPVTLSDIDNGHVEVTSVSGEVRLNQVDGKKVTVNTTRGSIHYVGDFGGAGDYVLANHSGDIEVVLPPTASVDLSARSVNGSVQQDYPFTQKPHPSFALNSRSFAGTSNSGASSVQLRSFSGTIRVKKQ